MPEENQVARAGTKKTTRELYQILYSGLNTYNPPRLANKTCEMQNADS